MWQPDVTVAAVCEKHGQFLLVEERSKSSQKIVFNQPAGHIEEGESVLAAVVRETLEETCRHFVPESLIGFYRYQAENGKTYLRYTFCGSISDVDSSYALDPDIIRTHWLSLDAIRASASLRSPLVINCINDYLSGQRYPLDILREI
jgi:ADP-ribose pyrophosphatase YjhB (NUDIX family)